MLQCIFHTPLLRGIAVEYGSKPKHHELNFIVATRSKKFSPKNKKDLGMACHAPPLKKSEETR